MLIKLCSINPIPKSNLLNYIDPQIVDGTIIDAAFFLGLQINPPDIFEEIAWSILLQINAWLSQLDIEHTYWDGSSTTFKINGPFQKTPTDGTVALKNSRFEE